jgi:murein DD-endopeptidase MepM/ murein hydrolase activator NlpD
MNNKYIGMGILATLAILAAKAGRANTINENTVAKITDDFELRDCDAKGCGHFHASRGDRLHFGIDVKVKKGQYVYSPINGYFNRVSVPYASDLKYKGVEIIGTGIHKGLKVKMWYCKHAVPLQTKLEAGSIIAIAQDISEKYGSSMTPHVHFQMYKNGVIVDPTNYIK